MVVFIVTEETEETLPKDCTVVKSKVKRLPSGNIPFAYGKRMGGRREQVQVAGEQSQIRQEAGR